MLLRSAIGQQAGISGQSTQSIAIGNLAGASGQSTQSIAIGTSAGQNGLGTNTIAIGQLAGSTGAAANSIGINASGSALNISNASSCYVRPIADQTTSATTTSAVHYNSTTYEVAYRTGIQENNNNVLMSKSVISTPNVETATVTITGNESNLNILNSTGSGTQTLSLPASPTDGMELKFININTDAFDISANGNSFDGTATTTITLNQYDRLHIIYYSSEWYTF